MPKTSVVIYQDERGKAPLIEWLKKQSEQVQNKSREMVALLAERGHELRRPHVENVGGGIYELRVIVRRVQHRILYAFVGHHMVLLTHGLTKTDIVPPIEIERAIEFREKFVNDPKFHTYKVRV